MKRLICGALILVLACGCALAGGLEDVFSDPEISRSYVFFDDEETAREMYDLLDCCNDEADIISAYGSLTAVTEYLDGGDVTSVERTTMIPCDYGRMVIMETDRYGSPMSIYACGDTTLVRRDDGLQPQEHAFPVEQIDHFWENYLFPFAPIDECFAIRNITDDIYGILAYGANGMIYEFFAYGTPDELTLLQIYRYDYSGDEPAADMCVSFDWGEVQLPDDVAALFRERMMEAAQTAHTTGSVNLRTGPGLDYAKTGSLPVGVHVEYLGEYEMDERGQVWYNIACEGLSGWASGKYVDINRYD